MLLSSASPGLASRRFCDPQFLCVPGDGFLSRSVGWWSRRVPWVSRGGAPGHRRRQADHGLPGCLPWGLKLATIEVRGTPGNLYECSPQAGAHFGGVLLRWREAGVVMAVSLYGHNVLNQRLVVPVAAHMQAVLPSRGQAG